MKLLPLSTDHRNAFSLDGKPPAPPTQPGQSVIVESTIQGEPMAFVRLQIGRDERYQTLGPSGMGSKDQDVAWRIDEIKIDDVSVTHVNVVLDAKSITGDFGVGRQVFVRATNVDDRPGYFNATWELEDVQ